MLLYGEIIISIVNQISSIHTDFLALRYKFNVLFTDSGKPIRNILESAEIDKLKWRYYEEGCLLLSKFQSLEPLLLKFIPALKTEITKMDGYYQNYRREIRANQPIFQSEKGKTEAGLNDLKKLHRELINGVDKQNLTSTTNQKSSRDNLFLCRVIPETILVAYARHQNRITDDK